jgi:hypothetical protein
VSLDHALADIMNLVPECIATGWIDMATGALLRVRTVGTPAEVLELAAAFPSGVLEKARSITIEISFDPSDDDTLHQGFRDLLAIAHNRVHLFSRGDHSTDYALMVVTRDSADLGAVIRKTRSALASVETVG